MLVDNHILLYLILVLSFCVVILFFSVMSLYGKFKEQKKRYDDLMGTESFSENKNGKEPTTTKESLEQKIDSYFKSTKEIEKNYSKLLELVEDIDTGFKKNVQKIGLVRYNPFAEMGGNLCFALAILDGEDNGIVINGIHSRTGSFTYAKPIERGVSIYILSDEELRAIEIAKEKAHKQTVPRNVKIKGKVKKTTVKGNREKNNPKNSEEETYSPKRENSNKTNIIKKEGSKNESIQGSSNNNSNVSNLSNNSSNTNNTSRRIKNKNNPSRPTTGGKRYSVGDVTEAEKNQILVDGQEAVKIARAYPPKHIKVEENIVSEVDNLNSSEFINKTPKPKRFSSSKQD